MDSLENLGLVPVILIAYGLFRQVQKEVYKILVKTIYRMLVILVLIGMTLIIKQLLNLEGATIKYFFFVAFIILIFKFSTITVGFFTSLIFESQSKHLKKALEELSKKLSKTRSINDIFEQLTNLFLFDLRVHRFSMVYLLSDDELRCSSSISKHSWKINNAKNTQDIKNVLMNLENPVFNWLKAQSGLISNEKLEEWIVSFDIDIEQDFFRNADWILPIFYEENLVGVLLFEGKQDGSIHSKEENEFIVQLGIHLGSYIENARIVQGMAYIIKERTDKLYNALDQYRAKEKEVSHINEIVQKVNSSISFEEVLSTIYKSLKDVFEFDTIAVFLPNEKGSHLFLAHMEGEGVDSDSFSLYKDLSISMGSDSANIKAFKQGTPIYIPKVDINSFSKTDKNIYNIISFKSALLMPLQFNRKSIGTINFINKKQYFKLKHDEILRIQRYVQQVSNSINNANLAKKTENALLITKEKEKEIAHINQISQIANSTLNLDTIIYYLNEALNDLFSFDQMGVAIKENDQSYLKVIALTGSGLSEEARKQLSELSIPLKAGKNILSNVFFNATPLHISSINMDLIGEIDEVDKLIAKLTRSKGYLLFPLIVQNKAIGIISFGNSEQIINISNSDISKIERYVTQIATSLFNAKIYNDMEFTKSRLSKLNKMVKSSIEYSQVIQNAILPDMDDINHRLPDNFFLWQPRDIVGGDFYQFYVKRNEFYIILGDCTGHGVPGGFMTMLSIALLERVIFAEKIREPAKILDRLNWHIKLTLKQDKKNALSDEGLDGAICLVKPEENKIIFAGSCIPLVSVKNGVVETIRGNNKSVGNKRTPLDYQFKSHEIVISPEKSFYLYSDGIIDQIGGKKGFRFGKKRLFDFFSNNAKKPFSEQHDILKEKLIKHQGSHSRRDDVTVIGFKIDKNK